MAIDLHSRATPPDVRLALRQEARFGCCRCGSPILEYHHIVPWEEEHHFRVADMMVFCPGCHDMATKGAISLVKQRKFKALPHNVKKGYASGLLHIAQPHPAFALGGNVLIGEGPLLTVEGKPLLAAAVEDGEVLLSLRLNGKDGEALAEIEKNEWVAGDSSAWDVEASYRYLKIRQRKNRIAFEFNAKVWPIQLKGQLWDKGRHFAISPTSFSIGGQTIHVTFRGMTFVGSTFDISAAVGAPPERFRVTMDKAVGYKAFCMMGSTTAEDVTAGIAQFADLKKEAESV